MQRFISLRAQNSLISNGKILSLSVSFSLSLSLACIVCYPTLHEYYSNNIVFDFKYRIFCLDHVLYRILHGTPSIGHLRWCHHNLALEYHVDDRNYLVAVVWAAFHCDVMPIFVFEAIVVHVWLLHDLKSKFIKQLLLI